MAVSTVSSLAESFMSGVPLGGDHAALSKNNDKGATTHDVVTSASGKGAEVVTTESGEKTERSKEVEEEGSELTEQSDDDGGMLEVHA
jgi:cleavage and polyadenylation specificity factor subunit 3